MEDHLKSYLHIFKIKLEKFPPDQLIAIAIWQFTLHINLTIQSVRVCYSPCIACSASSSSWLTVGQVLEGNRSLCSGLSQLDCFCLISIFYLTIFIIVAGMFWRRSKKQWSSSKSICNLFSTHRHCTVYIML